MKWKKYIYCACLAVMAASCAEEDALESVVDFSTPYVLEPSDDPVDARRYELFQTYGVPVFFEDTLTVTEIGKGYDGEPIYRYETLDIDWKFTNKDNGNYKFGYIVGEEAQLRALDYVEIYLRKASKPMRPFSIFVANNIRNGSEAPDFVEGMRTLFISLERGGFNEKMMENLSTEIITTMVLDKVKQNKDLVTQFEYVSDVNNYYGMWWSDDLGVSYSPALSAILNSNRFGTLRLENAYDEANLSSIANHYMLYYIEIGYGSYMGLDAATCEALKGFYGNINKVYEIRDELVAAAAEFGFICGDASYSHFRSPDEENDLETFVKTILDLGSEGFTARYGQFPLVMQKYNILMNYITGTLELDI